MEIILRASESRCFNPCRVFSGLATEYDAAEAEFREEVSIPVGFFQALQPS